MEVIAWIDQKMVQTLFFAGCAVIAVVGAVHPSWGRELNIPDDWSRVVAAILALAAATAAMGSLFPES